MTPLYRYLQSLDKPSLAFFARAVESSVDSLWWTARAHRTGGVLDVSPQLADRIERASGGQLQRPLLSTTCATCPYTQKQDNNI